MTGMERRGTRVVSSALAAWERETDAVRAEYRRRERQAQGSGDGWLAQRADALRQLRDGEDATAEVRSPLALQPAEGPKAGGLRAGPRARGYRTGSLARLVGGGGQ